MSEEGRRRVVSGGGKFEVPFRSGSRSHLRGGGRTLEGVV